MAVKKTIPTYKQIQRITREDTLQAQLERITKMANERMRRLEKAGYDTQALQIAKEDLNRTTGNKRFSKAKGMSEADKRREIRNALKFLNYQTSTIRGEDIRVSRMMMTLKDKGYVKQSVKDADFAKFLKSSAWETLKGIDSGQIFAEVSGALSRGKNIDDLIENFEDWLKDESASKNEFEILENWTGVEYGDELPEEWQ